MSSCLPVTLTRTRTRTRTLTLTLHPAMPSTKGVILVGGPSKGTRMRPLTLDCKPDSP